jgi:hypothetical protein
MLVIEAGKRPSALDGIAALIAGHPKSIPAVNQKGKRENRYMEPHYDLSISLPDAMFMI